MSQKTENKENAKEISKISENATQASVKSPAALREEKILAFWEENDIFKKTLELRSSAEPFVFYDGPPFATGLPHFGHILPTTMKDVIPRYKTMRGYFVPRRWGWDCHGLPIENLVEKELGLNGKVAIEEYGIEKFNDVARANVLRYADEWKKIIPRLGRFVDMDNDYRTMNPSFTESVIWSFKKLYDKGLVYEGFKSMHICPRCETTLSNFEISQNYKDITDISVFVKFELDGNHGVGNPKESEKTYMLAWTTTPWTLPGNVALAINPEIEYLITNVKGLENEKYIFAKSRLEALKTSTKNDFDVVGEIKGSDLVGKYYKPVFEYYKKAASDGELKNPAGKTLENGAGWKICAGDFVTTEDGTGVVHIAPAFGEDDLLLAQKENLPFIQHVSGDGRFKKEVTDFAGGLVKPKDDHQKADIEIIKWLAHNGYLFAKEKIIHSYPHCWRCDTPLLNYATTSWFVAVSTFKDKLLDANKSVNWSPKNVGEGRFGKWLENARDWSISRGRYWGAPLPIWQSETGLNKKTVSVASVDEEDKKEIEVLGSLEEIKEKTRRNRYVVMRHGEAEHNVKNIMISDVNAPYHLTEKGKASVIEKANDLKERNIDLIIASPLIRTQETARLVADTIGYSDEIIIDDRIRELGFGDLEGKSYEEYRSFFRNSFDNHADVSLPNGECMMDIRKRVGEFLYDIDSKYEGKNILVITHDGPAKICLAVADGATKTRTIKYWNERHEFLHPASWSGLDFAFIPHNKNYELDFHRPFIDEVVFKSATGKTMKRIPDVFDTWYDSGSMPFAQAHYPFSEEKGSSENEFLSDESSFFPADFIAEGQDQTRGWFYSLLVLGVALFGKSPYENVVVNGTVLAEDGQKMSKRLKNYPDLMETVNKFGADALRYFFMSSPAVRAEDISFSTKGTDEVLKKNIQRLDNVVSFYDLYKDGSMSSSDSPHVLDRWIIARMSEVGQIMTKSLDAYEIDKATRPIADFIDDLSTWYLRRSRDRLKVALDGNEADLSSSDLADKKFAIATLRFVLENFAKLIAPIMPFLADDIYQKVKISDTEILNNPSLEIGPLSVHLCDWPVNEKDSTATISFELSSEQKELLENMRTTRELVTLGLEARSSSGIKIRQPLSELSVRTHMQGIGDKPEFLDLIRDEVNVKKITVNENLGEDVILNTEITSELQEEGDVRDLIRAIQDARKEKGLTPSDVVLTLKLTSSEKNISLIKKYELVIKKPTLVKNIETVVDSTETGVKVEI